MTTIMQQFWFDLLTTITFVAVTSSFEQVLDNTEKKSNWNWIIKEPKLPSKASGWGKLATNPPRYKACDFDLTQSDPHPNYWLLSDQIIVRDANRIDVTVRYIISSCSTLPNKGGHYCVETFDLYVNQSDQYIKDQVYYPDPLSNSVAYEKVADIKQATDEITSETIRILVKRKYVILAFHNYGACSNLFSVKVTYNVCPDETLGSSLVSLPRTVAPANDSQYIQVEGNCDKDTVQVPGSLYVHCESNGEWNTTALEGRCICKEDMQNNDMQNNDEICKACPKGKYNDQTGRNCTVLPTVPSNITLVFVNQSAVELRWLPPAITGDQTRVYYDVDCRKACDNDDQCVDKECGNDVTYLPYKKNLYMEKVMTTNLSSFVNYTFKIYAKNRVSDVAKRRHGVEGNFTSITVRTNGSIPGKPEVSIEQPEDTVIVSWILEEKNGVIKDYHVIYAREDDPSDKKSRTTQETELHFKTLIAGKTYEFKVFAVSNIGKGPAGTKTFTLRTDGSQALKTIAFSAGGGGLALILLIILVVFIILRRRKSPKSIERAYMKSIEIGSELQATNPMNQRNQYIDPSNYMDLMELISTFTNELDRKDTKLEEIIGQGEFADVYKGILKTREGKKIVAVKVLRPGSSEKNQKDFLSEASIICQFNHPNVIGLIGVVLQSRPMMILTEFLESGSLDHFLQKRKGQVTSLQLIGMARGVACGMVYLSDMNFIHRDLAARNVLVGENMLCKVSDFGLSRELHATDDQGSLDYETQGGKIPVRWTAPEALQHRTFSSASDVWSFGVLLWEIMTFADRPYGEWNNYDVINRVKSGYRMPCPQGCPKVVHSLMLDCWEKDKSGRPKFSEIVSRFEELIRSPELLKEYVSLSLPNTSMEVNLPEFQSVDDWLKHINMEKYSETFQANGVNTLNKVTQLNEEDLKEMGIKLVGHRNKMKKSIKAMNAQHHNKGMDGEEAAI